MGAAEQVAALLAAELGWDDAEVARQVAAYQRLVEGEEREAATPAAAH